LVFIIISCLGTLNGLTLGASRGMYSMAIRNRGYKPSLFTKIESKDAAPKGSVLVGIVIGALWLVVWFGNFEGWWNGFMDISELPIAFQYAIFIGVYVYIIRSFKDENVFNRFIAPSLAIAGSLFIVYAAVQKDLFLVFMVIMGLLAALGYVLDRANQKVSA
jgi:APA family basic amino acid/polyamine antiporter